MRRPRQCKRRCHGWKRKAPPCDVGGEKHEKGEATVHVHENALLAWRWVDAILAHARCGRCQDVRCMRFQTLPMQLQNEHWSLAKHNTWCDGPSRGKVTRNRGSHALPQQCTCFATDATCQSYLRMALLQDPRCTCCTLHDRALCPMDRCNVPQEHSQNIDRQVPNHVLQGCQTLASLVCSRMHPPLSSWWHRLLHHTSTACTSPASFGKDAWTRLCHHSRAARARHDVVSFRTAAFARAFLRRECLLHA